MSSPPSNPSQPGLSYASVAAGTIARGSRSTTSSRLPAGLAYPHLSYASLDLERFQMSRQNRSYSVRAELDAGEPVGTSLWPRQSNGASSPQDELPIFTHHSTRLPFFTPTYLKRSRYVQRLKQEWEERSQAEQIQAIAENMPGREPSSNSSSTSNLHRPRSASSAPQIHRGVAQRVIEKPPAHYPHPSRRLRELPTRWHEGDRAAGVEVSGEGTEVRFSGVQFKGQDEAACIRADAAIPKEVGLYYYEVTIASRGKDALVGVGLATEKPTLSRLPGWEPDSFAYHGDDGDIYSAQSSGRPYGPHLTGHDVIGCGYNFRSNSIFFTRNGVNLGTAFSDIKPGDYYPIIGFKKPGDHVRTNFGRQPFVFDIDGMMAQERQAVLDLIARQPVSSLHPPDDEPTLIQNLIEQYLAHEGYVGTSRAFQQDLRERKRLAPSSASDPDKAQDGVDDIHATHRQRIRRAMLDGDVDRALKYTQTYFPLVLQDQRNKGIYFRLRCRRFIELMRRWSELSTANTLMELNNGHSETTEEDDNKQADTQMELDDQIQREATRHAGLPAHDDIDMDITPDFQNVSALKEMDLLPAAVKYGQGLREEFESDPQSSYQQELEKVFALLAYKDARTSDEVGHLVDKAGRSILAEELNGAILVSLGKPSSAALEKLCSQTESFLDSVAKKTGGAAALVNVQQDFLHS